MADAFPKARRPSHAAPSIDCRMPAPMIACAWFARLPRRHALLAISQTSGDGNRQSRCICFRSGAEGSSIQGPEGSWLPSADCGLRWAVIWISLLRIEVFNFQFTSAERNPLQFAVIKVEQDIVAQEKDLA